MIKTEVIIAAAGFVIVFSVVMWLIEKYLITDPRKSKKVYNYDDGYKSAVGSIARGSDPMDLYNQCQTYDQDDQWDKGWKQACLDERERVKKKRNLHQQGIRKQDYGEI